MLKVMFRGAVVGVLRRLACRDGIDVTDEIRWSVRDRAFFTEKTDDGWEIVLRRGDEVQIVKYH